MSAIVRQEVEIAVKPESIAGEVGLLGPDGRLLTQQGNAKRFLDAYRQDILWVPGTTLMCGGEWYVWDGTRWTANEQKVRVLAQDMTDNLGFTLVKPAIEGRWNKKDVDSLIEFWRSSQKRSEQTALLAMASAHITVDRGKFDADPLMLGLTNGVLDLKTGTYGPAERGQLITKQAGAAFDPSAKCPLWEKFILESCADPELAAYVQECVGVCLTGLTNEHLFFLLMGPAGTGKSTFGETVLAMLGDYAVGVSPEILSAVKDAKHGNARPDLAKLQGVRLAFANETKAGQRLDEGMLKSMTGGDTVTARQLYQAEFDFRPTHKIWFRTNFPPVLDGGDSGVRRRVRVVPFVTAPAIPDPSLPAALKAELCGILNWALAGWQRYQRQGFIQSAVVQEASVKYMDGMDTILQFLLFWEENLGCSVMGASDMYRTYKSWAEENGFMPMSNPRFKSALEGRGWRYVDGRTGRSWKPPKVV